MKLIKQISEYGNRPGENTWTTVVEIDEKQGFIDVNIYRPTPFCKDGWKDEMVELLNNMGWEASTMMGITGKSGLSPAEFIDAFTFIEAYKNVYVRNVGHPHDNIPLTLQEFLTLAEEERERVKCKAIFCMAFNKVYNKTVNSPASATHRFSDRVREEEKRIIESPDIVSIKNIIDMLIKNGFELIKDNQI